jgi:hypothetical protein
VKAACIVLLLFAVLSMGACSSVRPIPDRPGYPAAAAMGQTLDIQVARDGTRIELTNTTARDLGGSVLWINRWFSRPIESLAPGQHLVLTLRDFEDRYGERFRAGGFFAMERPEVVAVAELQTREADPSGNGEPRAVLLPLVVVGGPERQVGAR